MGAACVSNGLPGSNGNVNHISLGVGSSVDHSSSSSSPGGTGRGGKDETKKKLTCKKKKKGRNWVLRTIQENGSIKTLRQLGRCFHIRLCHKDISLYTTLKELGNISVACWLAVCTILSDSRMWHGSNCQYVYCQNYETERFISRCDSDNKSSYVDSWCFVSVRIVNCAVVIEDYLGLRENSCTDTRSFLIRIQTFCLSQSFLLLSVIGKMEISVHLESCYRVLPDCVGVLSSKCRQNVLPSPPS